MFNRLCGLAAAVMVVGVAPLPAVEVTFLYWSDFHAHNLPERDKFKGDSVEVGGAARLAGMLKSLRANNPRTLVLVAGDQFTGTATSARSRGWSDIRVLNALEISAFVPGNHEFDHGWRSLAEVTRGANFALLLANVIKEGEGTGLCRPDTVFNLGGVRVGVVGLIYANFTGSVSREGVLGLETVSAREAAADFVNRRRRTCDLLVALTHQGWSDDSLLAASVEGLDVIIGGHSHTPLNPPRVVNGTVVVQSGPYGRKLGRLVADVDTAADALRSYRGELLPVTEGAAPTDRKVAKLVEDLERKYSGKLNRVIGTLVTDWNHRGGVRSNLAQWAVDAMLTELRQRVSERISLAVINAGNLRRSQAKGVIRERDLWEICPFENAVVVVQLSGEELAKAVQFNLERAREPLIWSGLEVEAEGKRITKLEENGHPVVPEAEYSVAMSSYLWGQIESYFGITGGERPHFYVPDLKQRDLLIQAVIRQKVVSAPVDDRWRVR